MILWGSFCLFVKQNSCLLQRDVVSIKWDNVCWGNTVPSAKKMLSEDVLWGWGWVRCSVPD